MNPLLYITKLLIILLLSGCCHTVLPNKQPYIIAEKNRARITKKPSVKDEKKETPSHIKENEVTQNKELK